MNTSPKGTPYTISWQLISNGDENIRGLVSLREQHVGGTTEEKVVYEVIKLLMTMENDIRYKKSWIVLVGPGFTTALKNFYIHNLYKKIPEMFGRVFIIDDVQELRSTNFVLI